MTKLNHHFYMAKLIPAHLSICHDKVSINLPFFPATFGILWIVGIFKLFYTI